MASQRLRGELAAAAVFEAIGLETWQVAAAAKSEIRHLLAPAEAQAATRLAQFAALEACYGSSRWPATARLVLKGALH